MNFSFVKSVFFASFFLLSLSSCKKFQYLTVVGDFYKDQTNENLIETDTLLISYNFNGDGCPVAITVFNKSNQPLYIDWSKSSVIINGQRFSYWTDASTIRTNTESTEIRWTKNFSSTSSTTNGVIVKNERISFIPPKAGIVYIPISIKNSWIEMDYSTGQKINVPCNVESMNGMFYSFSEENTPFQFRSFITISTNEQFSNPRFFDSNFWVNSIIETQASPESLLNTFPNQFYNSKASGFGAFMGGVALTGVIFLVLLSSTE